MYRLAEVSVEHHRPVRRPGRALRPRVRRPARQPLLRRRAGEPHVLRPRPDRPAAAARRLPGRSPARSGSARSSCTTASRCSTSSWSTDGCAGIVVRDLVDRRGLVALGPRRGAATGGYSNVFFLSTNAMACNATAIWRAHRAGRLLRQPVLHADPPDVHPAERRVPVEAHADVGVAAQRRTHLGAEEPRRHPLARTRSPRTTATTSSSASTRLRQPRAARRRLRATPRR